MEKKKRVRYLKKPYGEVLKKIKDENRLRYIFILIILTIGFIVYYFMPVSKPSDSYILAEGYRRFVFKVKSDLIKNGFHYVDIKRFKKVTLPKGTMVYEIDESRSLIESEKTVFRILNRNGYEVYKRSQIGENQGYVYFVSYSKKPTGYILVLKKDNLGLIRYFSKEFLIKPRIAIIIDDFGYGYNDIVKEFLELGVKFNISVIPGHRYSRIISAESKRAGKEVIIHMPMEAIEANSRYNYGEEEFMLRTGMSPVEVNEKLNMAVMELPEAVGINNHMGSLATQDPSLMRIVALNIKEKGLYFIDSLTSPKSVAFDIMRQNGVKTAVRSVFLDNETYLNEIRAKFDKLKEIAKRKGKAIGIGHVKAETLEVFKKLIEENYFSDVILTYASEIVE